MTLITSAVTPPSTSQLVLLRDRHWIVTDVTASALPPDVVGADQPEDQHLVTLMSVDDDGHGDSLAVIWEIEVGAEILETGTRPAPRADFNSLAMDSSLAVP